MAKRNVIPVHHLRSTPPNPSNVAVTARLVCDLGAKREPRDLFICAKIEENKKV